jgi:hypothetical protein
MICWNLSIHILLLQKNSYADIQRLNLQLENWTKLVCIVYLHGTSQKSKCWRQMDLSVKSPSLWACFHPAIPSFSGICKVRKFLLNLQIPGRGWEVTKVYTRATLGRYKDNNSLGSMTCCKFVRDLKKSRNPGRWCHPNNFHSIFLEIQAGDLQRGWQ